MEKTKGVLSMFARQLTLLLDTLYVSVTDLAGYAQIGRTAGK